MPAIRAGRRHLNAAGIAKHRVVGGGIVGEDLRVEAAQPVGQFGGKTTIDLTPAAAGAGIKDDLHARIAFALQ